MSKKRICSKIFTLILALALLLPSFTYGVGNEALQSHEKEPDLYFFMEVFQYIKDNYPFEVENKHLVEGALKGMLQTLDPYSDYYTPEEAIEVYQELFNVFAGVGIYIEKKGDYIHVMDTIENSPAQKKGLKKGDTIVTIDGKDTKDLTTTEASKLIKGIKGTKVKLGIKRQGKKDILLFEITRDIITINPVKYEILENKIGYIKISEFTSDVTIKLLDALKEIDKKDINKLIIDLRDNPGGLLNQAISVSKLFVPKGPIVHIKEKNKPLASYLSELTEQKYKIVLLVNENSASAAEIVAAAVKDTKAGTIIGKKTFGKGIVQSMIPLGNGSMIKITTAEYLTPNKTNIHGIGITPDIIVEEVEGQDVYIKKGIEVLKQANK